MDKNTVVTTKLTPELYLPAIEASFFIGEIAVDGKAVKVNKLKDAIEDGTFKKMIDDCAAKLHNGETAPVIMALRDCLASKKTNMKKAAFVANYAAWTERIALLSEYTAKLAMEVGRKTSDAGGKPQWAYGPEDLDKIDDAEMLVKVIHSINDPCSGKFNSKYVTVLGEDYQDICKSNREYARKRLAVLQAGKTLNQADLLAKLTSGKAARLSKKEADLIATLLTKINK